jgi:hypothetical protein
MAAVRAVFNAMAMACLRGLPDFSSILIFSPMDVRL